MIVKLRVIIELDCAGCAVKIEDAAKATAGVKDCVVNFMMGKMYVEFDGKPDVKTVMSEVYKNCKKVESDCEIELNE